MRIDWGLLIYSAGDCNRPSGSSKAEVLAGCFLALPPESYDGNNGSGILGIGRCHVRVEVSVGSAPLLHG